MGTRPNSLRWSWEVRGEVDAVTWDGGQSWRSRRQGLAGSAVPAVFIKPGLSDPPLPALLSSLEGWEGMGRDAGSRDGGDGCTEPRDLPGRCQDKWGTRARQEGGKMQESAIPAPTIPASLEP